MKRKRLRRRSGVGTDHENRNHTATVVENETAQRRPPHGTTYLRREDILSPGPKVLNRIVEFLGPAVLCASSTPAVSDLHEVGSTTKRRRVTHPRHAYYLHLLYLGGILRSGDYVQCTLPSVGDLMRSGQLPPGDGDNYNQRHTQKDEDWNGVLYGRIIHFSDSHEPARRIDHLGRNLGKSGFVLLEVILAVPVSDVVSERGTTVHWKLQRRVQACFRRLRRLPTQIFTCEACYFEHERELKIHSDVRQNLHIRTTRVIHNRTTAAAGTSSCTTMTTVLGKVVFCNEATAGSAYGSNSHMNQLPPPQPTRTPQTRRPLHITLPLIYIDNVIDPGNFDFTELQFTVEEPPN